MRRLDHGLDPDLFSLDRLDHLLVTAPGHDGQVKLARHGAGAARAAPAATTAALAPLERDLAERRLHVHIYGVHVWGPPALKDACERLFAELAPAGDRIKPLSVIRIFGPGVPWAYHAEGEHYLNCAVAGRNVWHVRGPEAMGQREHEAITNGRPFLELRDVPEEVHDVAARRGARRAGPPPALRRAPRRRAGRLAVPRLVDARLGRGAQGARREPRPAAPAHRPWRRPARGVRDAVKRRAFDGISLATGKGREFRGVGAIAALPAVVAELPQPLL